MEHNCYELRCIDVGLKCDYVAKAQTKDELFAQATKHSAEVHGITEYSDEEMKGIEAAVKYDREC